MRFSLERREGSSKAIVGEVPPYRWPAWIRWSLRLVVFPFMLLDWGIQELFKRLFPLPYRLTGSCKKRGHCCHYILMHWSPWMERLSFLGRFWIWWHTEILPFYLRNFEVENEDGEVALVMSCRDLQDDGRCRHHFFRPLVCRQWPRTRYDSLPYLLKGCGYSYELRAPYDEMLNEIYREKEKEDEE